MSDLLMHVCPKDDVVAALRTLRPFVPRELYAQAMGIATCGTFLTVKTIIIDEAEYERRPRPRGTNQ